MPHPKEDGRVIRPAIPILLAPLGGIWIGLFLSESLIWKGMGFPYPVSAILLLLSASLFVVVVFGRGLTLRKALLSLLTAMVLGFSVGSLFWGGVDHAAERLNQIGSASAGKGVSIRVLEDARQGALSQTSLATIRIPDQPETRVRIYWNPQQAPLPLGTEFIADVDFKPLTQQQDFLYRNGIAGSLSVKNIQDVSFPRSVLGMIYTFREHNRLLLQSEQSEGSGLLRGVLLGDTTDLNASEAGNAYKTTGLSHLVAVSGSHLAVIASLISWFIGKLRIGRRTGLALILILLISYVFLTGLQPSAIRACIMTSISRLGPLMGRRGHVPSALAAAGVGMLLVFPPAAFSVGFWLSLFAVFGITIFCPLVSRHVACLLPQKEDMKGMGLLQRLKRMIVEPLSLTMTAQLATVAITAPLFSMISIVSPLANLLVTPFVTILVGGGIVTLCLMPILGPFGMMIIHGLCKVADISIVIAKFCANIPNACLPVSLDLTISVVVFILTAAFLYLLWPQPSRKRSLGMAISVVAISILLFTSSALPVKPQVVMLDIGQGDAFLVRDGTTSVLIDTGNSNTLLLKSLARQRVSHLDAVVITHLDNDHCGALSALKGTVSVDHVYFAYGLLENQKGDSAIVAAGALLRQRPPETLAFGDSLYLSSKLRLQVVWPEHLATKGDNGESVCLNLIYDEDGDGVPESQTLFTGDAETQVLGHILKEPGCGHFDVYKVGHHGSKISVTAKQLEEMGCAIALISVGAHNRYGHPAPDIIRYLEEEGVAIYRTDLNGDTVLSFSGKKLNVRCDTMDTVLNSS